MRIILRAYSEGPVRLNAGRPFGDAVNYMEEAKTMTPLKTSRAYGSFVNVPDSDWNDWNWQVRNRVETLEDRSQE